MSKQVLGCDMEAFKKITREKPMKDCVGVKNIYIDEVDRYIPFSINKGLLLIETEWGTPAFMQFEIMDSHGFVWELTLKRSVNIFTGKYSLVVKRKLISKVISKKER